MSELRLTADFSSQLLTPGKSDDFSPVSVEHYSLIELPPGTFLHLYTRTLCCDDVQDKGGATRMEAFLSSCFSLL